MPKTSIPVEKSTRERLLEKKLSVMVKEKRVITWDEFFSIVLK